MERHNEVRSNPTRRQRAPLIGHGPVREPHRHGVAGEGTQRI